MQELLGDSESELRQQSIQRQEKVLSVVCLLLSVVCVFRYFTALFPVHSQNTCSYVLLT